MSRHNKRRSRPRSTQPAVPPRPPRRTLQDRIEERPKPPWHPFPLIEIAVAGFKPAELTIEVKENLLTVEGQKAANEETRRFLHRGLAERNFKRRFQLADYVVVRDAQLVDGLLSISLRRELPEQLKPRQIEIKTDVGAAPAQVPHAA